MTSSLVVNRNTLGSKVQADAYLGDSVRASSWSSNSASKKAQCLITATRILDRQCWQGNAGTNSSAAAASVAASGTGYVVGDLLTVAGGTFGAPVVVAVTTVSTGAVTAVALSDVGLYSALPTGPVSTSGGTGSGCTLDVTWTSQYLWVPRSGLTDAYGNSLSSTSVPEEFMQAQFELAFELSTDAALEASGGQGSNTRRLQAGSASIEYFRPTGGVNGAGSARFSVAVMELIGRYLCGGSGSGVSGAYASGTGAPSAFETWPQYGLSQGYP